MRRRSLWWIGEARMMTLLYTMRQECAAFLAQCPVLPLLLLMTIAKIQLKTFCSSEAAPVEVQSLNHSLSLAWSRYT